MKIVLASSNKHKVQEMNDIVKAHNMNIEFVLPSKEFNPVENGTNFEENSYIKAYEAWKLSKNWVLADDSGLCIDALGGRPGIFSARYAETPQKRIEKILNELTGIDNRQAHFTCAMTLLDPYGNVAFKFEGICYGTITDNPRGTNGFGYDPIFLLKNNTKTMAELTEEEKNQVSHRAIALKNVLNYIKTIQD